MNKENPVIEEIKELANQIVEKIEGLTVKESFECENLMHFYRDVKWFIKPPRELFDPACENGTLKQMKD